MGQTKNGAVSDYVSKRGLSDADVDALYASVKSTGTLLLQLAHGAAVFDVKGQNVCMTDCLTLDPDPEHIRQLIFYSEGRLIYDWQYSGALLLGME